MAATLNYLIESNLTLMVVLLFYLLFLRRETKFSLIRIYMLGGLILTLVLPLMNFTLRDSTPLTLTSIIPTYWLPEVLIGDNTGQSSGETPTVWTYAGAVYLFGLALVLATVVYKLTRLLALIQKSTTYRRGRLRIAESQSEMPTFSFFNFILIGSTSKLSLEEKEQIIRHESVHARRWHSFDILLINLIQIVFWFNPFINTYKKIFVQLHEFEADARAVENEDVDKYCSLLARVALQSADFTMANHFNNSLTVKRIEMMRTIKSKIQHWKLAAFAVMLPLLFFFIACNDQVADDVMTITKNSSHALIIPQEIQDRLNNLKTENPGKTFSVLELNETASKKITDLESQFGLPRSMEIFKVKDGKVIEPSMRGQSASGVQLRESLDPSERKAQEDYQMFAILEFTEEAEKVSEASAQGDVYTVVEHQPEYPGGYDPMVAFIAQNLRYPKQDREQGLQGTVYIGFIVEKDGAVTNVNIVRGVSPSVDNEAKRVVESFPKWTPGKQKGEPVRVQFVLPIKFQL